jgi:hypothetical protein
MRKFIAIIPVLFLMLMACGEQTNSTEKAVDHNDEQAAVKKPMNFISHRVVDNAEWWRALTVGDVTNDGLQDVVYINNNVSGGYLGFRTGATDGTLWVETVVAETPPGGGTFAADDLETGDMDGDGDQDILAVKHTGEWGDAQANAEIFYYENPSWTPHPIGEAKGPVKDLSIGDFDGDGRNDLAVLTLEEHNLRIHQQQEDGSFKLVQDITREGLNEGMDLGDIDGDGDLDIAANGFVFMNPGGDLMDDWAIEVIDPKWNTQTGDWSANGTKVFVADMLGNGMLAIFISHSERDGYPLAYYLRKSDGTYVEGIVVDTLPAAHTLQVFDMDMDGDLDIVAGINSARAINLDPRVDHFEVLVFTNDGNERWGRKVIENEGIYNGRVADFEGDGDMDIFRYPNHEATELFFMENQVK